MEAQEILALDIGIKRTGIARASNIARIAEPLSSVPTHDSIDSINEYISKHRTEAVVVGLPRSLAGKDTDQTQWVRRWVDSAKTKINVPLYWQDEALTTKSAQSVGFKSKQPADEDAVAAAIILQDFLDSPETDRVMC